jgi:predicted enzyme related to lactoylglutathione lyase
MAEFKIPAHGTICWRELATTDLTTAEAFYRQMFGWGLGQSNVTEMKYSEIHIDDQAVGGMMPIDEKWGPAPPPSHWTAYVAVANADETAAKIKENGGTIRQEPFDAPNVGRIAMATDPSGANFAIIQFALPA